LREDLKKLWADIKRLIQSGMRIVDVERKYKGRVTASQISARKRKWEIENYSSGDSKWAKYQTPEYKNWRLAVLKRDGYKCVVCGRGKPEVKVLQADHILAWSKYPEKRFDITNGRTLCLYHHKRTLNYGRRALFCDDDKNGKLWEIQERLLWQNKQKLKQLKKQVTLKPTGSRLGRQRIKELHSKLHKKP
jgi:predicted restriction endonuclease